MNDRSTAEETEAFQGDTDTPKYCFGIVPVEPVYNIYQLVFWYFDLPYQMRR